jgi:hypothetical protein
MVKYDRTRHATDDRQYGGRALHAGLMRQTQHTICKTYCFATAAMFTRTHLSVTFIRILCLFCLTLPTSYLLFRASFLPCVFRRSLFCVLVFFLYFSVYLELLSLILHYCLSYSCLHCNLFIA